MLATRLTAKKCLIIAASPVFAKGCGDRIIRPGILATSRGNGKFYAHLPCVIVCGFPSELAALTFMVLTRNDEL
jgi:hypothetical protein